MSSLYKELATVYDVMYQTFIDYEAEFSFYHDFIKKYDKQSVAEIGCGSGSLAKHFITNEIDYIGFDLSNEMIKIACKKNPNGNFIQADMRYFSLPKPVDSLIITGRTISYLITNDDVKNTLKRIQSNLNKKGIVCFDFIDACKFIPYINPQKEIEHRAIHNQNTYVRKSIWSPVLQNGMDMNWQSIYYIENKNGLIEIGKDKSLARAFTQNELEIFLRLNGFKILELIERETYFFPTYAVVAEKVD